jgi:protein-S-isoprenylcysteine O-methyltransferase Ste14
MGIGVGLVLMAIGAVLTFAVNASFSGFSIATVGIILMVVGAIGLLLDLAIFMPRRRSVTTTQATGAPVDPYAGGARTVVQERQTY